MMGGLLVWLLLLSCLSLVGLAVSATLVARAQKEKEKREARLAAISHPKLPRQTIQPSAFTLSTGQQRRSLTATLSSAFGFDLQRSAQYPVQWWIVLPVMFGIAKLAQLVGYSVVGNLSYLEIPVVWLMLSRYFFSWAEKRRKQKAVVQFPDILDQIVRAVRVGLPVLEALRTATRDAPEPSRTEFVKLIDQVSIGTPLEEAVVAMARRCDLSEYSFFATALSLQNQTGGGLSETLLNLADVVRKRVAIAEKGKALSSEAKATAIVLTVLPFVTGLVMWVMNPAYISLLFTESMGHKLIGAAVTSLGLGLLVIRTMFQRALSLT